MVIGTILLLFCTRRFSKAGNALDVLVPPSIAVEQVERSEITWDSKTPDFYQECLYYMSCENKQ